MAPTETEKHDLRVALESVQQLAQASADSSEGAPTLQLSLTSRQLQILNVQAFFEERFSDTDSYRTKSPFDPLIPPDSPPLGEGLRVGTLLSKLSTLSLELDERSYQVDVSRFSELRTLEISGKFAPQLHLGAARLKVKELRARYPLETAAALLLADANASARTRVLETSNEIIVNVENAEENNDDPAGHKQEEKDDAGKAEPGVEEESMPKTARANANKRLHSSTNISAADIEELGWPQLENLDLAECALYVMDPSFLLLPRLRSLCIARNGLCRLQYLQNASLLTSIDASFNRIASVDQIGLVVGQLARLNLRGNKIAQFTPLAGLKALEELDCADNLVRADEEL